MLISVIVPVYRIEKYLKKCVDSLLNQTHTDYEILLVDDGSDDGCPQICNDYAVKSGRARALHKENGGLSDARNFGVQHSLGEYIVFVDGDDFVSDTYIADLANLIEVHDVDMGIVNAVSVDEEGRPLGDVKVSGEVEVLSRSETLKRMCYRKGFGVSAWGKIYKKDALKRHPYPRGTYYEDLATTYKIVCECSNIAYVEKTDYFYVQRPGSIIHSRHSRRELLGVDIACQMLEFMQQNYPEVVPAAICRYVGENMEYIPGILSNSKEDKDIYRLLRENVKRYYSVVIKDSNVSKSFKMRFIAVMMGYHPLAVIWKAMDFLKKALISYKMEKSDCK